MIEVLASATDVPLVVWVLLGVGGLTIVILTIVVALEHAARVSLFESMIDIDRDLADVEKEIRDINKQHRQILSTIAELRTRTSVAPQPVLPPVPTTTPMRAQGKHAGLPKR